NGRFLRTPFQAILRALPFGVSDFTRLFPAGFPTRFPQPAGNERLEIIRPESLDSLESARYTLGVGQVDDSTAARTGDANRAPGERPHAHTESVTP
ncbi:hypothetical protein, partial [Streptomyces sp. JJ66]|uniref:hypothetical protein n=1 Tax=Streptomyces sp. JJ66 TaxID=2803843 RepID=UPI001C56932B